MADQFKEWVHYFFVLQVLMYSNIGPNMDILVLKCYFPKPVCLNMAGDVAELNTQTQNHPHVVDRMKRLN